MTETFDLSKKTYHTNIFFRHVVQRMGLSTKGAGILLNIQENTISKWVTGKNFPPAGVFKELSSFLTLQEQAAQFAVLHWQANGSPDQITFYLPMTDYEAQNIGWPNLQAHRSVLALVQLKIGGIVYADDRSDFDGIFMGELGKSNLTFG